MRRYAQKTQVSSDRSRSEIEKTLDRYGATGFAYGWQGNRATIAFEAQGRRIRFSLEMPAKDSHEFSLTQSGRKKKNADLIKKSWEQGTRQRWRALALAVKAKLEAVESGIATFEDEFLAYIMLPNGESAGEWLAPQIAEAYQRKKMPPLLLGAGK